MNSKSGTEAARAKRIRNGIRTIEFTGDLQRKRTRCKAGKVNIIRSIIPEVRYRLLKVALKGLPKIKRIGLGIGAEHIQHDKIVDRAGEFSFDNHFFHKKYI